MTLDPTYLIQVQLSDGDWQFYSQYEYPSEADARDFASRLYGGTVTTRLVKVTRTVIEN